MGYGSCISENGGFHVYDSLMRSMELFFSHFLYFSCPISTTDSALLYRRQTVLEKNGG
jgi:hypothetical protein